ncbi:DUF6492 family protein [Roseofilum sp. Guam]|uniref:DUF6492 family protein n=1 Tax=Roseofilum sp. Guam TaxID=2821502 RepID=UPI001B2AEAF8|nr:DUF6492 family protein [Roseofilum sp. Guam]MBP0030472.1 hypothetical protein [Roseofilum sp. Guam]
MLSKIDVVIPVAAKDRVKLPICIEGVLAHSLTPIDRIYIIACQENCKKNILVHRCIHWIDEATYPFSLDDIKERLQHQKSQYNNSSWYYQQLLKFYVFEVIPDLQPHTLILDSDFFVSQDLMFLTDRNQAIFSYGYPFQWLLNTQNYPEEYQHSHIDFAKRLIPGWHPVNPFSGMHHHVLLNRDIVKKLFFKVENTHQKEFWQVFIDNVKFEKWNAASEYVIYYHFAMKFHPERVISRHLKSCDFIHDHSENDFTLRLAKDAIESREFATVGCHSFLDLKARLKTMDYIPDDLRRQMLSSEHLVFKLILNDSRLHVEAV